MMKNFNQFLNEGKDDTVEKLAEATKIESFNVEFNDEFDGQAPSEEVKIKKWNFSPVPAITVTSVEGSIGSERNDIDIELSNGHQVSLECKYVISPNPSDSKKNYATLKVNGKEIDVKDEYMGFMEDFGSPLIAVLKCYEKHYTEFI